VFPIIEIGMSAVPSARPLAPPHWTWRSGLEGRPTLRELDKVMDPAEAPRIIADDTYRAGLRALSDENARLRAVLGHCPKCIAVLDEEGQLVGYNHEFRGLFARPPELGASVLKHFDETDARLLESVIRSAGTSSHRAALVRLDPDSPEGESPRHVEFLVATLPWIEGGTIGVVLAGDDRTPELAHRDEMRSLSQTNSLGAFALAQSMLQHDVGSAQATALAAVRALAAVEHADLPLSHESVRARLEDATRALLHATAALERARVTSPRQPSVPADLRTCAQRAARAVVPPHARHAIYLDVRVPEAISVAIASAELTQLIANLLGNALLAVEEAQRAGHVELVVDQPETDAQTVLLRVRDDGVGIEPSRLVAVFDPFETTRPDRGAVGLGLAIARRIVESAGGSIKLMSEVGRGTEVVVELPALAAASANETRQ
ncbi:MAG: ATP-binding protein, partial [Polyangiales bacterium]